MKKRIILAAVAVSVLFSGCSLKKIINPTVPATLVFYNNIDSIKNEDVKSRKYIDLFLDEKLTPAVTPEFVKAHESRAFAGESTYSVSFYPECTADDVLGAWIRSCTPQYTFEQTQTADGVMISASGYQLVSNKVCTYEDYLYVMRALSLKYGECTTELYKSGIDAISITKMQQNMEVTEIATYLSDVFDSGELSIETKWIDNDYVLDINFESPTQCSITYTLK